MCAHMSVAIEGNLKCSPAVPVVGRLLPQHGVLCVEKPYLDGFVEGLAARSGQWGARKVGISLIS